MNEINILKNLERVSLALMSPKKVDSVIEDVLEIVFSIFKCDRIWLFYPCDPVAQTFHVLAEKNKPKYPGAFSAGQELPITPEAAKTLQKALDSGVPTVFDPESGNKIDDVASQFSVLSQIMMAVHPRSGKPWMFGMHQCSHARVWTKSEQALFKEISFRVVQTLNNLILLRNLKKSEREYRNLLENIPLKIFQKNIDSAYVSCNANFAKDLNIEPNKIVGTTDYDYFPKELAEKYIKDDQRIVESGKAENIIEKYRVHEQEFWVHTSKTPLKDDDGQVSGVLGVFQDITEQKKTEKRLKVSEERSRTWLEYSPVCTKIVDIDFNLQYMSSAGVTSLQIEDVTQLYGKPYPFDFYPESFKTLMVSNLEKVKATGEIIAQEASVVDTKGNELWFHSTLVPVNDEKGRIDYIIVVSIDITERKQAEETFQTIVQSTVGSTGQELYDNICTQLCNVFKSDCAIVGELIDPTTINAIAMMVDGKPIKDYSYQLPGTPCERATSSGFCHYPDDIALLFPDDKDLQVIGAVGYAGTPLKDHNEKTIGVLCVLSKNKMTLPEGAEDLMNIIAARTSAELERMKEEREKKQLEGRLNQAQKMEAIGTLAGGIAHDFNNILSAILGYGEMAKEGLDENSQPAKDIKKVIKAGYRAKDLVNQILAFSRQAEQELIPLKVQYIAKEALKLLRATIPSTIEISQTINASCGSVLADPTQIHQILMNLCTNASHAMHENGGVLTVGLDTVGVTNSTIDVSGLDIPPGDYVRLEVSDTGHGMSKDVMARVFDPFFTTKGLGEGTGLGLAVVHGIVKSYNGFINISSELKKGTIFSVYLPQIDNEIPPKDVLAAHFPKGKENVLVVDDEEDLVELMERMLTKLGYSVHSFTNSLEALAEFKAKPNKYDLVITDITMPKMTGVTLALEIMGVRPDASIILCSGYSDLIDKEKVQSIGISGYLQKPIIKKEVAQLVREVLDRKKVIG